MSQIYRRSFEWFHMCEQKVSNCPIGVMNPMSARPFEELSRALSVRPQMQSTPSVWESMQFCQIRQFGEDLQL